MDITTFVSTHRETLLIADYNTYRSQLSRQILATRKRLGRATNKREKFAAKAVTAEDVGNNHEFLHLLLLTAERAWAHGMHIKTSHIEDAAGRGITGSTRSHLISRLNKAAKTARVLVDLLQDQSASKASDSDILEGRAYAATLVGAELFEKRSGGQRAADGQTNEDRWRDCLRQYSEARVIYAALYEERKKDVFKETLANNVDPTIRYAAYQAHLSRTIAISTVARRYFPKEDAKLVSLVEQMDPYALKDKPLPAAEAGQQASPQDVPNNITWRGRKANIVDASIGQALAAVSTAEERLRSYLSSHATATSREKAAAYDDVLVASQDAADATKRATDELEKEKVDEGDLRMQDLRVTSLAVNYALVSWRVGRNRVLIGDDDGLTFAAQVQRKSKRLRKDRTEYPEKEEPRSHKLTRLRERVVLYDATIQSITSIKDLRGAMRDSTFVEELDAKTGYFRALKCINIAMSHSLLSNHLNALALLKRAQDLASYGTPSSSTASKDAPPTLDIPPSAVERLQTHIVGLVSRTHALVEMHKLEEDAAKAAAKTAPFAAPHLRGLHSYPTPGTQVNLQNLVTYPPKIEPVPVKPLFLDVAWNYIDYPGQKVEAPKKIVAQPVVNGVEEQEQQQPEKRRGWFGFSRS